MKRIYLDFNASTPTAPEAIHAMQPLLLEGYGNPSGQNWAAVSAQRALERARSQVAEFLGCGSSEVVFTSGGSESNNQVLKSAFFTRDIGAHIITSQIEHPSIIEPCRYLERLGAQVTFLPVDSRGLVDPDGVRRAIRRSTCLISIMHANNEVGTIQEIREISRIGRQHGVAVHTDASQSAGKIAVDVRSLGVDFLTIAGHKLYGPTGVGALYVRQGAPIDPLIHGGGQQNGRRAGTESALLAAGLGAACQLAHDRDFSHCVELLRNQLWDLLQTRLGDRILLVSHLPRCLPNTLNVSFPGLNASGLLAQVREIAASTGSACHSGQAEPSPVLKAMGLSDKVARGAVRFSLGRTTSPEEVEAAARAISEVVGASLSAKN